MCFFAILASISLGLTLTIFIQSPPFTFYAVHDHFRSRQINFPFLDMTWMIISWLVQHMRSTFKYLCDYTQLRTFECCTHIHDIPFKFIHTKIKIIKYTHKRPSIIHVIEMWSRADCRVAECSVYNLHIKIVLQLPFVHTHNILTQWPICADRHHARNGTWANFCVRNRFIHSVKCWRLLLLLAYSIHIVSVVALPHIDVHTVDAKIWKMFANATLRPHSVPI